MNRSRPAAAAPAENARELQASLTRAQRMTASMQRYLTLLTERPVATFLAHTGPAPAWSTESTVTFALDHLGDLTRPEYIVSAKGLALHEAAHIMMSPRAGGELVTWVHQVQTGTFPGFHDHVSEDNPGRETGRSLLALFDAYNMLEDQRIETALIGRFGAPVIPWLSATAAHHLLQRKDALASAHPYLWGRTFLPLELRLTARELYSRSGHAGDLSRIIDEYRELGHPELNVSLARKLIYEFAALMAYGRAAGDHVCSRLPVERHAPSPASAPLDAREQAELVARGRALEREALGEESDELFDAASAGREGAASHRRSASTDDLLTAGRRAVNAVRTKALNHVKQAQRHDASIYRGRYDQKSPVRPEAVLDTSIVGEVPSAETVAGSRRFGRELAILRVEHEAAWDRRTRSGHLNASRYLRGGALDEAFDRWELGRDDAVDLEVVIALDSSGSMAGAPIAQAAQAMWALKRAVDGIEGSCTVVTFNQDAQVLYDASTRAGALVKVPCATGGTDPYDALAHAEQLLMTSPRAVRLLVVITDGEWSDPERSEAIISDLRDDSVLTALVVIGTDDASDSHGCELSQLTGSAESLFQLGRDLVRVAVRRNLTRKAA
jgi:Mg-chelatase subunit ChlD